MDETKDIKQDLYAVKVKNLRKVYRQCHYAKKIVKDIMTLSIFVSETELKIQGK